MLKFVSTKGLQHTSGHHIKPHISVNKQAVRHDITTHINIPTATTTENYDLWKSQIFGGKMIQLPEKATSTFET